MTEEHPATGPLRLFLDQILQEVQIHRGLLRMKFKVGVAVPIAKLSVCLEKGGSVSDLPSMFVIVYIGKQWRNLFKP